MTATGDYRADFIAEPCQQGQHEECGGFAPAGPCQCVAFGHSDESAHDFEGAPPQGEGYNDPYP